MKLTKSLGSFLGAAQSTLQLSLVQGLVLVPRMVAGRLGDVHLLGLPVKTALVCRLPHEFHVAVHRLR